MLCTTRGFWKAFLLNIVTFGIYDLYLIHAFANETNIACQKDGKSTTGVGLYILFTILTFGIYAIVWNYKWIERCNAYLVANQRPMGLQASTYLLTIFLLGPLTLGIMSLVVYCKRLYLQNEVNKTYNELTAPAAAPTAPMA